MAAASTRARTTASFLCSGEAKRHAAQVLNAQVDVVADLHGHCLGNAAGQDHAAGWDLLPATPEVVGQHRHRGGRVPQDCGALTVSMPQG